MAPWLANALGLLIAAVFVATLAAGLLWRVGAWGFSGAASLIYDQGLSVGSRAPELAAHRGRQDYHLVFTGITSFVVFGKRGCIPCDGLLRAAVLHPVTRGMRLVYLADSIDGDIEPDVAVKWEMYEFHDEHRARDAWRAPVSPYFHVIGPNGAVLEKGTASHVSHLDRLLSLRPPAITAPASVTPT